MNCLSVFDYFVGLARKGLIRDGLTNKIIPSLVPVLGFYIVHVI